MSDTTTQIIPLVQHGCGAGHIATTARILSQGEEVGSATLNVTPESPNLALIERDCARLANMWPSLPKHLIHDKIDNISAFPIVTTKSSDLFKGSTQGTELILKTFRSSVTPTNETLKQFYFEALLLSKLNHPNIIPFLGICLIQLQRTCIVSKFMKHGTLPQFLATFPETDRLKLLVGVADAVTYLHTLPTPILHGDIRGMNVVVAENGSPYLIDMGSSLVMNRSNSTFFPPNNILDGSPRWTSGEKLRFGEFPLTLKADVYSFACLCVEVFSGEIPFRNLVNDGAVLVEVLIRHKHPSRPEGPGARQLTDAFWSLLESCFSRDPAARPSMSHVHHFIELQF